MVHVYIMRVRVWVSVCVCEGGGVGGGGVLLFSLSNYLKHIATYNVYSKSKFILVLFFYITLIFINPLRGNSGHFTWLTLPGSPYLGKATAAKTAALPIPITSISVCSNFFCPNNGLAASV